ncbi:MAG: hypothetical protein HY878_00105, partial [Deltaproteobacteria bacterium]|nr:hypothetical protein [Deltaproteobacteria bacterium]
IATQKKGIDGLIKDIPHQKPSTLSIAYSPDIEEGLREIEGLLPDTRMSRRSLAIMLLSGDETLTPWLRGNLSGEAINQIEEIRFRVQSCYTEPLNYILNLERLRVVDGIVNDVVSYEGVEG